MTKDLKNSLADDFSVVQSVDSKQELQDNSIDCQNGHFVSSLSKCDKCKNHAELFLTKLGSGKFEFTSWVALFPLGPFYSIWRHLSPKKKLCYNCIPASRKPPSKAKNLITLLVAIAFLALFFFYKDEIAEANRQIQIINQSLKQFN